MTTTTALSVAQTFSVAKVRATVSLGSLNHTYDGTAKTATATTNPPDLNVRFAYSQNGTAVPPPTNVGSYDVVAMVDDANYSGEATGTLVISQATMRILLPFVSRHSR